MSRFWIISFKDVCNVVKILCRIPGRIPGRIHFVFRFEAFLNFFKNGKTKSPVQFLSRGVVTSHLCKL